MLLKLFIIFLIISTTNCFQTEGIDVSRWQGDNIDFKKVKEAGYTFVIIRAGYGYGNLDMYFEENYRKAKEAGLNVGAYWYSYAKTENDGKLEADYVLEIIKNKQFEYPIFYDIEENNIFNSGITNQVAQNFCNLLEGEGYFCGLYASKYYLLTYFSEFVRNRYTIWVAQYYTECTYTGNYGIWQKSSQGSVPGIYGNVDLDISYINYSTIMKEKHLNNFKEEEKTINKEKENQNNKDGDNPDNKDEENHDNKEDAGGSNKESEDSKEANRENNNNVIKEEGNKKSESDTLFNNTQDYIFDNIFNNTFNNTLNDILNYTFNNRINIYYNWIIILISLLLII